MQIKIQEIYKRRTEKKLCRARYKYKKIYIKKTIILKKVLKTVQCLKMTSVVILSNINKLSLIFFTNQND